MKLESDKPAPGNGGMTVPELMVSIGVASLVLMAICFVFACTNRTFAEMGNYVSMDRSSRATLDRMSMRIRQARSLTSFSPTHLVFDYDGLGTTLTYDYDQAAAVLTEQIGSRIITNLTDCERLTFSLYDRSCISTPSVSEGKVLTVGWRCSGKAFGKMSVTTEDMQQAQIVMRNQP